MRCYHWVINRNSLSSQNNSSAIMEIKPWKKFFLHNNLKRKSKKNISVSITAKGTNVECWVKFNESAASISITACSAPVDTGQFMILKLILRRLFFCNNLCQVPRWFLPLLIFYSLCLFPSAVACNMLHSTFTTHCTKNLIYTKFKFTLCTIMRTLASVYLRGWTPETKRRGCSWSRLKL